MTEKKNRRTRGFTLVELCVGLIIGSIIGIGMMTLFRGGIKIFTGQTNQLEALQSAMLVSEVIKEDLSAAVLSGMVVDDPDSSEKVPDFRPFKYDANMLTESPPKPPVGSPDPVDIGNGGKLIFFKTVPNASPAQVDAIIDDGSANGTGLAQTFQPDRGYKLVAVRYSAGREKVWQGKKYFSLKREVFEPGNPDPVQSKIYANFRLRKLVFFMIGRDWDNLQGLGNYTPPQPPFSLADAASEFLDAMGQGDIGGMVSAAANAWSNMINSLSGNTNNANANNQNNQANVPDEMIRDQCYYVQFFITGLSSKPVKREFLDFTSNTLMHVIAMDSLTEKVRTANGAMFWNSFAQSDGYLASGTFDNLDE